MIDDYTTSGSQTVPTLVNAHILILVAVKYSVASKAFKPRLYLRDLHQDATESGLRISQQSLRTAIEQQSESLRRLVQDNLDTFVNAKSTIDTVYEQIKVDFLKNDGTESMSLVKDSLNGGSCLSIFLLTYRHDGQSRTDFRARDGELLKSRKYTSHIICTG